MAWKESVTAPSILESRPLLLRRRARRLAWRLMTTVPAALVEFFRLLPPPARQPVWQSMTRVPAAPADYLTPVPPQAVRSESWFPITVPPGTVGVFNSVAGGNVLVGQHNGANVFRVDATGKGYFDGGTQTGGADFAESVTVRGDHGRYEPSMMMATASTGNQRLSRSQEGGK